MKVKKDPPILSIVGLSGSGKTTLLEKLIPEFTRRGLRVGTIKHDVHGFEMDHPGKDSWRHKHAGAAATIISSAQQIGMVMDADHDYDPADLVKFFQEVDIIMTEGYKNLANPKLEVFRSGLRHDEPICIGDENLLAVITDLSFDLDIPRFSLDDMERLTDFLIANLNLSPGESGNLYLKPEDRNYRLRG